MDVISRFKSETSTWVRVTGWVLGDFVVFGWDPVEISL